MGNRWLSWFALAALAAATQENPVAPDSANKAIVAQIESIRAKAGLPALGGAIVTSAGLEGAWVTGERAAGSGVPVELDDPWHLGSCNKSMTATLIALLVERGDLTWEMKLPALLPELAKQMEDEWRDVTLVELLSHRAGVPSDLSRDGLWGKCWQREGTPTEQRRMLTKTLLGWKPVHPPKGAYLYANAGVAIAGHIAETVTGKPYEKLMQELLFAPLGITSAGFGAPGTEKKEKEKIDTPRGHDEKGQPIEPGPQADNPPAIAPGGTCYMSLADWGKYIALHLKSAKGDVTVGKITLHAATTKRLHTAYPMLDGADASYGFGWNIATRPWAGGDGTVWTHNGTNTMWFCVAWLAPNADFAVLSTTNMFGATGSKATDDVAALLIGEHGKRAAAKQH